MTAIIDGIEPFTADQATFTASQPDWRGIAKQLADSCAYPRYGDTATLLERVADTLDHECKPGWESILSPHLRRAAVGMRTALAAYKEATNA